MDVDYSNLKTQKTSVLPFAFVRDIIKQNKLKKKRLKFKLHASIIPSL